MDRQKKLLDESFAKDFYNTLFSEGYMDEWDDLKKSRVTMIIRSLNLPDIGKMLDFGCGNGIFAQLFKKLYPNWDVYGSDLSDIAIAQASERCDNINFFVLNDENILKYKGAFDFIFSHHVFEHVSSISKTASVLNDLASDICVMMHVMPCGNEGSLEHTVCSNTKGGILTQQGDAFFYEADIHVRRLTTDKVRAEIEPHSFNFITGYYDTHYHAGIEWICGRDKDFIKYFANPDNATSEEGSKYLAKVRSKLLFVHFFFAILRPGLKPLVFDFFKNLAAMKIKNAWTNAWMAFLYPFALPVSVYYHGKGEKEFDRCNHKPNGAEMYLIFKRA